MKKVTYLTVVVLAVGFVYFGTGLAGAQDESQTASDLWQRIQGDNYRENWALFPGKGKLYKGTEPHGMLLTTYVNKTAGQELTSGAKELAKGSILIKENYMPDKTLAAITVMEKTGDGKDDWFWVKYNPDGTVATMEMEKDGMKMNMAVAGGQHTMCAMCHAASVSGIHNIMTPIASK
ncbi:MAG: hypothetical protein WBD99_00950 [Thermodesulfobacteriota bacterium]